MTAIEKPKMLGELLVEKGLISRDHLQIALTEQHKRDEPLGKILVVLGFVTEAIIRDVLGEAIGQESVDLSRTVIDADAMKLIDKETARRYHVLPISYKPIKNSLKIAMSDTQDVVAIDQLASLIGNDIEIIPLLAGEGEIEKGIDHFYGHELSVDGIISELESGELDFQDLPTHQNEYNHPLVRLVDGLLYDAVTKDASDIHFEPEYGFLRVRYRIDGVLRQIRNFHKVYWPAIAVRIKVIANMNIAETREPQDGRISMTISGRAVDFRVSSQPTTHGENIVIRVLDREKGIVPLDQLGISQTNLELIKTLMSRPEGLILVSGPTGTGKTTSLYSMLNSINHEGVNIMTLEDPVEYPMNLIRQTSLNETARLSFSTGIRSILRQDPDIILVGEIRDEDTAEMALRAAMTGHQVYSTLHANSVFGVVPRLINMGVNPRLLAGHIIGIISQRLLRIVCNHCKQEYSATELEKQLLDVPLHEELKLFRAPGCEHCGYQGFKGRTVIMEILKFDLNLDDLIANNANSKDIRHYALEQGFRSIGHAAKERVIQGITSLHEAARVADLTDKSDKL